MSGNRGGTGMSGNVGGEGGGGSQVCQGHSYVRECGERGGEVPT